ncbi:LysR substrate-binding domain-containing protein [Paraburkholderia sp. IMGN_8]|uniref:LysR substrate-binding domain-containing protein n=1 Tax=Paraburkholderia sp. IMGN_8 TaxID=3136564 RepID=UPI003100B359
MNRDEYEVLLAIIDEGSLTAAARSLGRTLQSVSRAIAALERDLNTTLFHRTTRRVQPTAACLKFAARLRPALGEIEAARDEIVEHATQLRGGIRVGAPTAFGAEFVSPLVAQFLAIHENVRAELVLAEQHLDLAKANIDLVVRLGHLPDSNLRARQVGTLRRVVFGSPAYFVSHGYPVHPSELAAHDCILRQHAVHETWKFNRAGGAVEVAGRFRSASALACNTAAAAGAGIGRAPIFQVQKLLDAGQVVTVLDAFEPEPVPVHLLWAEGRPVPRRVRALIDFLAARLASGTGAGVT